MPKRRRGYRPGYRWRIAAVTALSAFLAACGGGSKPVTQVAAAASDSQPISTAQVSAATAASSTTASAPVSASAPTTSSSAAAAAPTPASTPVIGIVYYGDDQVSGVFDDAYGNLTVTSPTEPIALQTLLQSQFNDTGLTVTNSATGGTSSTLKNELAGVDGGGQSQPARMIASGAKIAVEAHSINDFLGGETVEQFQSDLIQWVEDAQASGIQPVLQEPSPICGNLAPQQAQYVDVIDSVGQQLNVPVIKLYSYVQSLSDWESHMQNCQIPDATLNQLEAQQAQAVIAPLVKKIIGS